ncbi:MAG: 4Fe-4S binding protein [Coriobacteriales bacterium]|jgi:hydrogenase-4 component H|nr:4Fe-4S binding protein [Coriobacteriales bacterium]
MLKTLKEIIRTGDATVKYPFAPIERPKDARGKPEHDLANCMACGACAVACPPNAIQMVIDSRAQSTSWSINYGRCVYCGRCEEVCPTKAIRLSTEFELAVMDKNDLEEICMYSLQSCTECGSPFAPAKEVDYAYRILTQFVDDPDARQAAELVKVCPRCKQKRDSQRAKQNFESLGGVS